MLLSPGQRAAKEPRAGTMLAGGLFGQLMNAPNAYHI